MDTHEGIDPDAKVLIIVGVGIGTMLVVVLCFMFPQAVLDLLAGILSGWVNP